LTTGVNDVSLEMSIEEYAVNIQYIVAYIESRGAKVIILDQSIRDYSEVNSSFYTIHNYLKSVYKDKYYLLNLKYDDYVDTCHWTWTTYTIVSNKIIEFINNF